MDRCRSFFCLSGYLITTILLGLRGRATPYKTFYSRRLVRILPPYLAVIVPIGLFVAHSQKISVGWIGQQLFFLQAFSFQQNRTVWDVLTHPRWYLEHLPPLVSAVHGLPIAQIGAPLTVVIVPFILWSLSIEEYFYLLWAPVVLRLSRTTIICVATSVCVGEMVA